ncbi:MAG: phosphoadenylyl-sulfate reductase [Luteitalea sp.]|nr:phosphoadenylyl-sulfate reductase [Luteitalea sp.]
MTDLANAPLSSDRLEEVADHLEGWSVRDILAWACDQFAPRLTLATGFGTEGCVLIDAIGTNRLPVDLFTLDTGLLFPQTYALWRTLESRYDLTIRAVRPRLTVEQQAVQHGPALWTRDPDACCAIRKALPLRTELAKFDAWISAIRREQTPARARARVVEWDAKFDVVKINPLAAWTKDDVWTYIDTHDVPVNPLHEESYPSIGCMPCTSPVAPGENERAGRWRGRAKTECGLHDRLVLPLAQVAG